MNTLRPVLEIARWEFFRWFKWKDQFFTLGMSLLLGIAIWGGKALLETTPAQKFRIVILNHESDTVGFASAGRIEFTPAGDRTEESILKALAGNEIDGFLVVRNHRDAELIVSKDPLWKSELENILTVQRLEMQLTKSQMSSGLPADRVRPFQLRVRIHGTEAARNDTVHRIGAGVLLGLMLVGVMFSAASQFVSITGEKQLRITEQIISAVTPQQWIDGKILGISAFSLVRLLNLVLGVLLFLVIGDYFGTEADDPRMDIPIALADPFLILVVLLVCVGGFVFWNTSFAALASTINDPNTSSKTTLLFVPFIVSIGLAIAAAFRNPESTLAQVLTLFPATGPATLTARLVLTDVAVWEIGGSFLLLAGSSWLMRRAAAKVFRVGMLMYGKEPTTRELWRWIRETHM